MAEETMTRPRPSLRKGRRPGIGSGTKHEGGRDRSFDEGGRWREIVDRWERGEMEGAFTEGKGKAGGRGKEGKAAAAAAAAAGQQQQHRRKKGPPSPVSNPPTLARCFSRAIYCRCTGAEFLPGSNPEEILISHHAGRGVVICWRVVVCQTGISCYCR